MCGADGSALKQYKDNICCTNINIFVQTSNYGDLQPVLHSVRQTDVQVLSLQFYSSCIITCELLIFDMYRKKQIKLRHVKHKWKLLVS